MMERQFTATVYIIDRDRVLLIQHRKLCKWLPPGGHIDPNETPPEAARRDAQEETGLEIEFVKQENVWIDRWNAKSFERPYMCLLEEIPAHNTQPAHQHIDMIYLARPVNCEILENTKETLGIRWFTIDELEELEPDVDIFSETLQVVRDLLNESQLVGSLS